MRGQSTVREILQRKTKHGVVVVESDTLVFDALRKMATYDVGALPVIQDGMIAGILSERDYARKIALVDRTSKNTTVAQIMSDELYVVNPDTAVEQCLEILVRHFVRYLLVQEDNRLIGILSMGDILKTMIADRERLVETLGEYAMGPGFTPWRENTLAVQITTLLAEESDQLSV